MIVYFNLYLRKLEQEILNSEFIETLDPILIKEFKKAINSMTPEYWAKIENLFKENINYVYSADEQMAFSIVASKLGLTFLERDPEFCGELISILVLLKKNPLNYVTYVKIFLSEPLYSCITSFISKSRTFSYHEFLEIVFERNLETPEMSEENYNALVKSLFKIQEKTYHVFITKDDSLKDIYEKIHSFMMEENTNNLTYSMQAFETLNILLSIIDSNNELLKVHVKESILQIDENNYTRKKIIQDVLSFLISTNLAKSQTRSRYHA